MDHEKKKIKPLAIEKNSTPEIESKPAATSSNNESEFVIKILNEKENENLPTTEWYYLHNTT